VDGVRLRIGTPIRVLSDPTSIPGRIRAEKSRVLVGAAGGYLELDAVQPTGKKPMAAADWARGYRGSVPESADT
jgi:methionyl-tRNA formyltransferase